MVEDDRHRAILEHLQSQDFDAVLVDLVDFRRWAKSEIGNRGRHIDDIRHDVAAQEARLDKIELTQATIIERLASQTRAIWGAVVVLAVGVAERWLMAL